MRGRAEINPSTPSRDRCPRRFVAMAGDWRVVVVKLADRLHNMRTLEFMPPKKRTRIARETLEIFAPLAHRLGIWTYKTELEDAAFRHLYPGEYLALDTAIKGRRKRCEAALESCRQQLEEMLYGDELVRGRARRIRVEGRTKSAYSTWKKMRRQQCGFCLLYTSPSPRDGLLSRMPSSA